LSAQTLYSVVTEGARFNETLYTWMEVGGLKMEIGFMVDGLTAMMMCVVTFVSLMVHIYTIGYMAEDKGYNRFFAYISLFTFSMLMLVMSNNLLQLFFGWEAVGLVSYLLIGFWFNKPSAVFANMKAFLVNRVGDFGFILGIGLIAAYAGSLNYTEVFGKASELGALQLPGTDWMLITVICICLFVGAMGKSAQFPLHVWLPDSMEGPTPISALIHAATMVTAGIFMVARMSPLFELSDTALNLILVVGSITALFMGFLGIVQNDIKRVVAYSTLSQLGYMTVALGASAYSVAVFHLMTHAFFKALLFLGAGSVIMGMHHNQDIRWMGGVRKYMPITWITSLLGSLALIGTPFFSGFYSKDSIIEAVAASHLPAASWAHLAVLAGVFITAFYSFRMYFLVFHGKERFDQNPDAHHGHGHDEHHAPHESPWVVTLPLVLLAIPSVLIGYLTIEPMLFGDFFKDAIAVNHGLHPAMSELGEKFHGALAMAEHGFGTLPFALALAGVVVSFYMYMINPRVPAAIERLFKPVHTLWVNKYYLDAFNEQVLARGTRWLATGLWKGGDQGVIDGFVVNGSWQLVGRVARFARRLQTGYLYHYALLMILGMFALITYFVWIKR
jgi:NADH-quinone oxidoreductase subunit L